MLHKISRQTLSSLIYFANFLYKAKRQGITVLNYHRINDELSLNELVVGKRAFFRQMEYLYRNKYNVIGVNELLRLLDSRHNHKYLDSKTVVITFDDGYLDNYQNAFPILKRFGFTAVIFLTAGYINTNRKSRRYKNTPWQRDFLNSEEIKEMADFGITFGAHTLNHIHLTEVSLKEAKREIEESKQAVSRWVGLEPKAFAYPYGEYNQEIEYIVKDAGFALAFTVKPGINTSKEDIFALRRTGMSGLDTRFDFRKKLAGAYDPLHLAVQGRKRKLSHI